MTKPTATKMFRVTADVPLSGDAIVQAETIANMRPAVEALRTALAGVSGSTINTDIVSSRPKKDHPGDGDNHD